jgi:hypothetical protein
MRTVLLHACERVVDFHLVSISFSNRRFHIPVLGWCALKAAGAARSP